MGKCLAIVNQLWGIWKRSSMRGFQEKMRLYETLVYSIKSYGIESWGWKKSDDMERVLARYVKGLLGIDRNTPSYLWRMETGILSVETRNFGKMVKIINRISNMENGRWPKICLQECIRGLKNNNPSTWGREMKSALQAVGSANVLDLILQNKKEELKTQLEEAVRKKKDQEMQINWGKIDKSSYCTYYKEIKKDLGREDYLLRNDVTNKNRETWSRMRMGNGLAVRLFKSCSIH